MSSSRTTRSSSTTRGRGTGSMGPPATTPASKRTRRDPSPARGNTIQEHSSDVSEDPVFAELEAIRADNDGDANEAAPDADPLATLAGGDELTRDLLHVIGTASLPDATQRISANLAKALAAWGQHVTRAHAGLGAPALPGAKSTMAWVHRLRKHGAAATLGTTLIAPLQERPTAWDGMAAWAKTVVQELVDAHVISPQGPDPQPLEHAISLGLTKARKAKTKGRKLLDMRRSAQGDSTTSDAGKAGIEQAIQDNNEVLSSTEVRISESRAQLQAVMATRDTLARLQRRRCITGLDTAQDAGSEDPTIAAVEALHADNDGEAPPQEISKQQSTAYADALSRTGGRDAPLDTDQQQPRPQDQPRYQSQQQPQWQPLDMARDATDDETKATQQPQQQYQRAPWRDTLLPHERAPWMDGYQQPQQQPQQCTEQVCNLTSTHVCKVRGGARVSSALIARQQASPAYDPAAPAYRPHATAGQPLEFGTRIGGGGQPPLQFGSHVGGSSHGGQALWQTAEFEGAGAVDDGYGRKLVCGQEGMRSKLIAPARGVRGPNKTEYRRGLTYLQSVVGNAEPLQLGTANPPQGFLARRYQTSKTIEDMIQETSRGTEGGSRGGGRLSTSQQTQQLQDQLDTALPRLSLGTSKVEGTALVSLLARGKVHLLSHHLELFVPTHSGRTDGYGVQTTTALYLALENLRIALIVIHGVRGSALTFGFGITQLVERLQELDRTFRGDLSALLYIVQELAEAVDDLISAFTSDRTEIVPSFHPDGPIRPTLQKLLMSGSAFLATAASSSAAPPPAADQSQGQGRAAQAAEGDLPICRNWCRDHARGRVPAGVKSCGRTFGPNAQPCRFTHPAADKAIAAANANGW